MIIREFLPRDEETMVDLFLEEVDESYISHGEMQMGLSCDGVSYLPDFKEKWREYFARQVRDPQISVLIAEDNGEMIALAIFGIESDFDKPYGVLYDFMVANKHRGQKVAEPLFNKICESFDKQNIDEMYFESGSNCHRAHTFYTRRGAKHISNIYKIEDLKRFV